MRRLPVLAVTFALAGGTALASETEGPMATAGASGAPPVVTGEAAPARTEAPEPARAAPMTTAEQIDAFIKNSPAAKVEAGALADAAITPDRRVHGEVSVGVGTHGYRSVHVRTEAPIGKSGWISLSAGQTEGRGLYPGCYGPGAVGPWDGPGCGPVFGY
ncbi:hypothetical protein [Phenylobacterium sp.]|uniref:hypothetical protein n=1 Tax=Phenylobacterium sp. TaxID=1871053 RepID=UPI00391D1B66